MQSHNRGRADNLAAILLRDLIQERTGIFFSDNNMDLVMDKISPLVLERGGSLLDYYYRLKYDNDEKDWSDLVDVISVRETFFWREFDQIRSLVEKLMPALATNLRAAAEDLECGVRLRRGTSDHRNGSGFGWLV